MSKLQSQVILHLQKGGLICVMDSQNTAGRPSTSYRLRASHVGVPKPPFERIGKHTFDSLMRKGVLAYKERSRGGARYYWLSSDYDHLITDPIKKDHNINTPDKSMISNDKEAGSDAN